MFNIIPFLSYVFVVTFTPGPNNIMSMANGSNFGYRKTLKFMVGIFSGFFILMILSSYFNLLLYNYIPRIKVMMGVLGAIYMLYLAYKIMGFNEQPDSEEKNKNSSKGKEPLNSFLTGMSMQFVNPKVILYGLTVMSSFIIPYYQSNTSLVLFSLFLAFVSFTSVSCWALFGSLFNRFLSRYRKQFNIIMALLLVYSAISISGIMHLLS